MYNLGMENKITITQEQFDSLIKLSEIEVTEDARENSDSVISRALIALERKLNFFNYPSSFFTASTISVLIIDDTELSIFQLSTMLKKIGMNVYVARTKEEALAEFKKKKFDFLVLDLYMPDYKDGFELIETANMLKQEEGRNFKIIAISGTDNPEIIKGAYKLQIDEFIPKAPDWHEKIIKFIANSTTKVVNEEYTKYYINDNICAITLYKVNSEKYVNNIVKEVNANVMTGKQNIIFNLEHVKIFQDNYANLFSEVYKATSPNGGIFAIVKPCEDVLKSLEYVFLTVSIPIFNSTEEAINYITKTSVN